MTSGQRMMVAILVGAAVALTTGCPNPPPEVPPPAPKAGTVGTPQERVPPPVERPIPPERQGDVPEVPPPVKP